MRKILLILPVLAGLAACERSFDITKQLEEGVVWMSFIPSNDYDTTFFIVQGTTPLIGYPSPKRTSGESVSVKVNGQSLELEKSNRSIPDRMQFYATEHVFSPGDLIEVTATIPGLDDVSASCEMPGLFPDYTWKARNPEPEKRSFTLYVDIDYADPNDEGGFYGAVVLQRSDTDSQEAKWDPDSKDWIWGEIKHRTDSKGLMPTAMTDLGSLSAASETPVSVMPRYYNFMKGGESYSSVQIWKDIPGYTSKEGRRHITIASTCYEGAKSSYYEYPENSISKSERRYTYRIVLYRFSESFYNYLKAQYNNNGSEFFELGLAPVSYVYTNVHGGTGVCGAYTVTSSDWIELDL